MTKPIIFYDRNSTDINGWITIRDASGKDLITRVLGRSGQPHYQSPEWARGRSPIPFGWHYLHLDPVHPGWDVAKDGIGEFYPISSDPGNKRLICKKVNDLGLTTQLERWDIGLHEENKYPGSAGCIVPVYSSNWDRIKEILHTLRSEGHKLISMRVL